jgi:hypothetical protein
VRGAALGLRTPGRRREDDVAIVVGHDTMRRSASAATPACGWVLIAIAPTNMGRFNKNYNTPL